MSPRAVNALLARWEDTGARLTTNGHERMGVHYLNFAEALREAVQESDPAPRLPAATLFDLDFEFPDAEKDRYGQTRWTQTTNGLHGEITLMLEMDDTPMAFEWALFRQNITSRTLLSYGSHLGSFDDALRALDMAGLDHMKAALR